MFNFLNIFKTKEVEVDPIKQIGFAAKYVRLQEIYKKLEAVATAALKELAVKRKRISLLIKENNSLKKALEEEQLKNKSLERENMTLSNLLLDCHKNIEEVLSSRASVNKSTNRNSSASFSEEFLNRIKEEEEEDIIEEIEEELTPLKKLRKEIKEIDLISVEIADIKDFTFDVRT